MKLLFLIEKIHIANVKRYNQFLYHIFVKLGKVHPRIKEHKELKTAFLKKKDASLINTNYISIYKDDYVIDVCSSEYIQNYNHVEDYDFGFYFTDVDLFDGSTNSDGKYLSGINLISSLCKNYKSVHYEMGEKPSDLHLDKIKKNKLLTGTLSPLYNNYNNIFSDFRISLIHFYYASGYNFLSEEQIECKKENLLGFYHIEGYNPERDFVVSRIYKKFQNNLLVKNYSTWYKDNWENYTNLIFCDGWSLNFSTSYTDFIKSSVGFISESISAQSDINHYPITGRFTDKLFKAIFFSKYNIPFIIHTDSIITEKMNKYGFWFLNFEFIDFNKFNSSDVEQQYKLILQSIDSSVNYLVELYNVHGNIEKVNQYIQLNFSKKLKNNTTLFDSILNDVELSNDLFDFIMMD